MSTIGGRRTTRASTRAASRAPSEAPTNPGEGPADVRSPRAGSGKTKRSIAGNKDTKTYGSKIAAAGAERMAAAAAVEGHSVGGIAAALNQAQDQPDQPAGQIQEELQAAAQENASRGQAPTVGHASSHDQSRIDRLEAETHRSDGNQPLEGFSVLREQITLSSSDTFIDRTLFSLFQPKHYLAMAAFLLTLLLLFADIYRGPLLGQRLDLFKGRFAAGNQTVIALIDMSSFEHRLKALETKLQFQPIQSTDVNIREKLIRQVNYFSGYNFAEIDWSYTSPSRLRNPACAYWHKTPFWRYIGFFRGVPTCSWPVGMGPEADSVLNRPWDDDSGPAWCAPNGEGKLQLGIRVQVPVTPTELVVEHLPRTAELDRDRAPAPKEIELWMEIIDDSVRQSIGRHMGAYGVLGRYELSSPSTMTAHHVPIGRWTYDYNSDNYIQLMPINIDIKNARSTHFVVRVNSNWADSDYTCLYRLRLHGISGRR
ncbi:MAG: hypothetical protein L6R39_005746 [Caloplaca ligustica]|nr:MAG: hypothetical protein L6R39_005746 [Caloplaca ligustica]